MYRFIIRKLISTVSVILIVSIIVFAMLRVAPGDPATIIAGDGATVEQIEQIRKSLGLDRPMLEQFTIWSGSVLHGDFGKSLISNQPVAGLILDRFGATVAICVTTILFSILLAIPIGALAAWKQGAIIDRLIMAASVTGFSVPVFITEYLLILLFSMTLRWLPVQGYVPLGDGLLPFLKHIILPVAGLSTIYIALIARIVRTSILEVLNEDYIRTARAKGLPESVILFKHAMGNAAVPIVTIIGVTVGLLLGGVVITESVFNIPGLGRLVVDAVLARDYPVIQAVLILSSMVYVLINLVTDVIYSLIDPRIQY
ncbi:ABC transporter permease [uncultured Castellaniella sp.]|uniref:ABC transporter permease n=1 Tax=uncultured Castellaniella sp. TaxID=647907 RepID=UPI00261FA534|nr:ABC transporter permease [uncultured Castellaniella sp.]